MIVQRVIDILSRIVVDAFNNAPQATGREAEPNTGGLLIAGPSGFPEGPVLLYNQALGVLLQGRNSS